MLRKVLYIDLSKGESWVEERQELFENWMGGTGVGIKLLQEECPAGTDPLSPAGAHNPLHRPTQRHLSRGHQDRGHLQIAPHGRTWASPMPEAGSLWP